MNLVFDFFTYVIFALQGWKRLGIPTAARHNHKDGPELDMNLIIKDLLMNGDHIFVSTSLQPSETA